jgi:hypothetical protein
MTELTSGQKIETSYGLRRAVKYILEAQKRLDAVPAYSAKAREVARILKDLVSAKAMFDVTEGLQFEVGELIDWRCDTGLYNRTCTWQIEGYINAHPNELVQQGFDIGPFGYDGPNPTSIWQASGGMLLDHGGKWYVTVDDVETEDTERTWLGILPHNNDGWMGAYTTIPLLSNDHPWQKLRWWCGTPYFEFNFVWTPTGPYGEPVPIQNTASPSAKEDDDPY